MKNTTDDSDPELMWAILKAPIGYTPSKIMVDFYTRKSYTLPKHITDQIRAQADKKWEFIKR